MAPLLIPGGRVWCPSEFVIVRIIFRFLSCKAFKSSIDNVFLSKMSLGGVLDESNILGKVLESRTLEVVVTDIVDKQLTSLFNKLSDNLCHSESLGVFQGL